jgi:signal transduction histidine kinase
MSGRHSGQPETRTDASANAPHAEDRLAVNKDRILLLWEERLRKQVAAAVHEPQLILINTLPAILDQLAEALSRDHPRRTATQGSTVAQEHGGERVRLTQFRLEDIIAEYKILRQVLFEVLDEEGSLSAHERSTLNASVDQAIQEACTGYALVRSSLRDQFFAILAHDMRTPLNVAQSTASMILRDPLSERVGHWATRIIENISRVDRMAQDLLDAMRVETGARLPIEIKHCDLVAVVRETLERLQTEYGDRFILKAPEPLPGYVDPDALQRAVENLAVNAVKYGAPSHPITVSVTESHSRAILTVHNHGAHIPIEKQETLFRAFQRLTEAETSGKPGWGLGLAQVRGVAEAHGGSIGLDSLPEGGTTFIIDIPVDARPYQDKPVTPSR